MRYGAGEWRDDVQEGLGTCVWADGSEFRGAWKTGVRHGRGVSSRPGYTYDGEWADNNFHGTGTCRFEDGSRYLLKTKIFMSR
jgi:1-phosphatidylinositol-4-phosphate 5-kinase